MIAYKVENLFSPPELGDARMEGAIASQMEAFLRERIFSKGAREVIYPETERQFTDRLDDSTPVGMWRGEFWGKWIISACRAARYKRDGELKEFIRTAARNVINTADADGYIGSYKDPLYVFPLDPEIGRKVAGWPTTWNWNIWCRKYVIWGLIESYQLTGDAYILEGVKKTADQLIDMLDLRGIRLSDTGVMVGLPSGSIIKPLLILYRETGDAKYLDFCARAAEDWNRDDGKCPNLIANSKTGRPLCEWYPDSNLWAKAYEMMSCLDGLLELYRITGDIAYFNAVRDIYALLKQSEYNPLFSVGFNDVFFNASKHINAITEPCDVIHFMRLGYELFCLTGDSAYIDDFERAFLNPFLAASFADGKWGARGVRCLGRHLVATNQSSMRYSHCCVNNMPRGYMNACEAHVMRKGGDIYVNMYADFSCDIAGARVEIRGSYLRDGRVEIAVSSPEARDVYLRVPSWSANTLVNGERALAGFHRARVEAGKSVILIKFDMNPRVRDFPVAPEDYAPDDPRVVRFLGGGNDIPAEFMLKDRRSTVLYGPLLLTRSRKNGNSFGEMFESGTICARGYSCRAEPAESETVRNAYRVTFIGEGGEFTLNMCDFATGSNEWSPDDPALFNIYV